ncbi:hypothetical protein ALC60_03385 [Trachymyrmex zeteki]|uniref:Uncharacterized protein n=1 Tax=Mycetomoellerius zeteki TaxID=64791 RepID=A0A151XAP1_9HYME|nr:hypothetical protein ALC60_03385 [Trachymyrmex zeteki]
MFHICHSVDSSVIPRRIILLPGSQRGTAWSIRLMTVRLFGVHAAEPRLDIADPWRFTIHEEVAEERRDRYLNERTAR